MAQIVFYVVAEDPKKEHVACHMKKTSVQEHRGKKWKKGSGRTVIRVPGEDGYRVSRHHSKFCDEGIQLAAALHSDREFPQEDQHIQDNQKVVDEWRRKTRLVVAERNHLVCNLLICNW